MTVQHTPGPWYLDERERSIIGKCDTGTKRIAVMNKSWPQHDPDARLIAAAPELLASLEEVLAYCVEHGHNWMCMAQARAAIAKATGGAA